MTYKLYNHLRDAQGYTFAEKTILKDLASISRDDETVLWSMENLCHSLGCSERTARRNLRRIEEKKGLIPRDIACGRGHVLNYAFNVGYIPVGKTPVEQPLVEPTPVVPPTNGHVPPPTNGHKPDVAPPRDPYKPEPLTPEQIADRRAKMEAARARIAAKPRPEKKYDRPGRTERAATRMVQGRTSLDGYPGGDETS